MLTTLCVEKNKIDDDGMAYLASALQNQMVGNIFEYTIEYLTFLDTKSIDSFSESIRTIVYEVYS
jgi:hypothetical protein